MTEGVILKVDNHERAWLKTAEGVRLALESRQRAEEEQHIWMKDE